MKSQDYKNFIYDEKCEACSICSELLSSDEMKNHVCDEEFLCSNLDDSSDDEYVKENQSGKANKRLQSSALDSSTNPSQKNNVVKKKSKISNEKIGPTLISINFDDATLLIAAVQNRPPLWDHTLPLEERGLKKRSSLWKEVSEELEGKLNPGQCQTEFKSLQDTYRKLIQSEHRPSGSAAPSASSKWVHYKSMEFLRHSCLVYNTVSNYPFKEGDKRREAIDNVNGASEEYDRSAAKKRVNKKVKPPENNAAERIAEAICSRKYVEIPEPTEISSFSSLLGFRLEKMPESVRNDLIHEILTRTHETLRQQ